MFSLGNFNSTAFSLVLTPTPSAFEPSPINCPRTFTEIIDLYFLLEEFTLDEMIEFYLEKYFDGSRFMVIKSLTYFVDADNQQTPDIYSKFNWETCKQKIIEEVIKL
jgi:hypothetical protein